MAFLADISSMHGPMDVQLGGKARSLAQLAATGLATPPGFVVTDALFRWLCPLLPSFQQLDSASLGLLDRLRARIADASWPAGFQDELHARLGLMVAGRYAVRSSFADEDTAGHLGAGIYESRVGIAGDGVEQAIREVLASALSPGAVAYALARGRQPASVPVAVLVHDFVAGEAEGSAAFASAVMDEPLVTSRHGQLPAGARAELQASVVALAQAQGPVEIEWVWAKGSLVYLQARPFQPPPQPVAWSGWNDLGDQSAAHEDWRWDAAHNPLPLSPAQAGLVALVDQTCSTGVRQRVLGGYLFYRRDDKPSRPLPPAIEDAAASAYFESLRLLADGRLAALGPHPALEPALALFVSFYEPIFAVLQPALRRIHKRFHAFLADHAPAGLALLPWLRSGVSSMASERRTRAAKLAALEDARARDAARAEYLALFGDEAPVWDVCVPTYAENPSALLPNPSPSAAGPGHWQGASAEVEAVLVASSPRDQAPSLRKQWQALLQLERDAVALGEADDWLYARVQAAVRRALLAVGEKLGAHLAQPDDVFFVPFDRLRALANGDAIPPDLAQSAQDGRAAWEQARRLPPPSPANVGGTVVHGVGTGGRAIGRVVWHRADVRVPTAVDAVLVARTLLPTELPLISAAAIVTETGGPLDHVAAQARERAIPAVVGAQGASAVLAEGDLVLVDADHGLVVRLL